MRILLLAVLLSFASATFNVVTAGNGDAAPAASGISAADAKLISVDILSSKRVQCAIKEDGAHCINPHTNTTVVYQ
jgi:hypothetical protein